MFVEHDFLARCVEGLAGLGTLPEFALVGAGEQVVDVPATLAARVMSS